MCTFLMGVADASPRSLYGGLGCRAIRYELCVLRWKVLGISARISE